MKAEDVLKLVEDENVQFVRLQFSDINGNVKNVEIPTQELPRAFERGIMFDGSSIEGFVRIEESDMYLRPDPETFAILPWTTDGIKSARLICDVYKPDGTPFEGDPRYRLKLVVEKAKKMGFVPYAGPELEFFVVPRDSKGFPVAETLDRGSYFDLLPLNQVESLRSEAAVALRTMGIDVEASHHEGAPSQHEVDFRYDELVRTADNTQTVKLVLKTIAIKHNLHVTFMPKPFFGINGSGMHTHLSLFRDGENAFHDPSASDGLSKTLYYFVGGLIAHAKEITALTNPTVNSYKRLVPGYEAPVNIAWSKANRSALIRIPAARGKSTRIEYRAPDPSCNAYLALAVMMAAGLDGIEKRIEPPLPIEENIYAMSDEKKAQIKIESLPGSLKDALEEMKNSTLVREVLGEHIFRKFLDLKRREWREFSINVTDWEIRRYLNV
ncbi:MAG: Glutamine synthetase [Thermotoga sp. 50_1627]|uniref:type I glutamate--ammonia ligase n=1 Tax=Pseudothermotoga sp. TaxID=2033661 RepID=UPI00076D1EA3|nr:MAG: Glutamine synthetase [Thermotoga sp. 50_64]KUK25186.1 MAG: Glutamine synthetase [Thermotoga sp. 50_1627]MBC7116857.1 type I glutamate--ammonia ligase [Pseudothermotoga sp.]MDK2923912.1 glutamine synthetase [Pseudothermotoga sp.]HBT39386.1 type I glutamate--ammonia ligase [Pseudothermotoga sp.]